MGKILKNLGIFYGNLNTNGINWIPCVDKFRQSLAKHFGRNVTIFGKSNILNYVGYSKLWHKAVALKLPDELCYRTNGKAVNTLESLEKYTLGFLWGYCNNNNTIENNTRTKKPLIRIETLYLERKEGGTGLINFREKMKAFRIMLVFKYFESQQKPWKKKKSKSDL